MPGCSAVRKLGGGPSFEVYAARDEASGSAIVCKLPRPDRTGDQRVLRRLRREAQLLSRIEHPAVPKCLRVAAHGPRPHLLMEYCDGPNLRQRLRRSGPLPLLELARLARDIADALSDLEAHAIVHLDVKPANVVLAASAKLVDFSLARPLARARSLVLPVGTAEYMAPETRRPGPPGRIGHAADVWGLGATLYEALGAQPLSPAIMQEPATLPSMLPREMTEIILACLRRSPARRPRPGEIVQAMAALLGP